MELRVNGKIVSVSNEIHNVLDLLKHFEMDHTFVIVELNEQIIQKEAYEQAPIVDGDRIEMIHFVGGG